MCGCQSPRRGVLAPPWPGQAETHGLRGWDLCLGQASAGPPSTSCLPPQYLLGWMNELQLVLSFGEMLFISSAETHSAAGAFAVLSNNAAGSTICLPCSGKLSL